MNLHLVLIFKWALSSELPNYNQVAEKHCARKLLFIQPIALTAHEYKIILFHLIPKVKKSNLAKYFCQIINETIFNNPVIQSLDKDKLTAINREFKLFWGEIVSNFDAKNARKCIKKKNQTTFRITIDEFCTHGGEILKKNNSAYQNIKMLIFSVYRTATFNMKTDLRFSPTDLNDFFGCL